MYSFVIHLNKLQASLTDDTTANKQESNNKEFETETIK